MSNKYDVTIEYVNEVNCRVVTRKEILTNIREKYSFFADGYKYTPLYKQGSWDGRINMIDAKGFFPSGLLKDILRYCKELSLTIKVENIEKYLPDNSITDDYINKLASTVVFPPYDYQLKSVKVALKNKKQLILSPTGCLDGDEVLTLISNQLVKYVSAKDVYDTGGDGLYIPTPTGVASISDVYRKYGNGVLITFHDGTTLKCAVDHLCCNDDGLYNWKSADKFKVNDVLCKKTIISIESVEPQYWYDFTVENESHSYYHKGIVHHNSGKSCIAYMMLRHCIINNIPMLITVPSTSLVEQLFSDFESYVSDGLNVGDYVSKLYGGQDKQNLKSIVISTWQTASLMDTQWLNSFNFYLCDEAHMAKAKMITEIINNMPYCQYRIGMTGTLSGSSIHEIEMNARFGSIFKMVTTRELIDRGILTEIGITCQKLIYSKDTKKHFSKYSGGNYQKEIEFIVESNLRNNYIKDLALKLPNTSLMLFNRVETHGVLLFEDMQNEAIKNFKRLYFISGKVKSIERENIRQTIDSDLPKFYTLNIKDRGFIRFDSQDINISILNDLVGTNMVLSDLPSDLAYYSEGDVDNGIIESISVDDGAYILLASYGTLAVGVNIKNLHNLLLCHPYKGKIINLQSIGRILRKSNVKNKVHLYDFIDDFCTTRKKNHTYKHGEQRIEIYEHEEFDYDIEEVYL